MFYYNIVFGLIQFETCMIVFEIFLRSKLIEQITATLQLTLAQRKSEPGTRRIKNNNNRTTTRIKRTVLYNFKIEKYGHNS